MTDYVIQALLVSSLLVLFLLAVRKGLRRYVGSVAIYALWALVAVSLLLPLPQFMCRQAAGKELFPLQSPVYVRHIVDGFRKNQNTVDNNRKPGSETVKNVKALTGQQTAEAKPAGQSSEKNLTESGDTQMQPWKSYWKTYGLFDLWLFGFLLVLIRQFVQEEKFRKHLLEARSRVVAEVPSADGMQQRCYSIPWNGSPFLFRSRGRKLDIYIPEQMLQEKEALSYAILHESVHQRHGDIWWAYLRNFLVALYWFHPLVWVAAHVSREDCELACDAAVVEKLSEKEKLAYGKSLLYVAALPFGQKPGFFTVATNLRGSRSQLEKRIRCMRGKQTKNRWVLVAVLVVALAVSGCGMAVSAKPDNGKIQKENVRQNATDKTQENELTLDQICTDMKNKNLTEEDFESYSNWVQDSEMGYDDVDDPDSNYYINFDYPVENDQLQLKVSFIKGDHSLFGIWLQRKSNQDMICLYNDMKKTYVSTAEDVQQFIDHAYDLQEDVTFQVPKGLTLENYDATVGDYGGCLLTPDAYEGDFAPDEWKAAGYVMRFSTQTGEGSLGVSWKEEQISDVSIQWNHTEVKKLGKISGLAASAYLIKTEHDLYTAAEWSELEHTENAEPVSSYWCIVMARPEDAYGYVFALNAKNYTKEDAIAFAKTVRYVE